MTYYQGAAESRYSSELIALVDGLGSGTLNEHQRQTLQALRDGILALAMVEPAQV